MARLLDTQAFVAATNRTDVLGLPPSYTDAVFDAVDAQVASYLHYEPWLAVRAEEGPVHYLSAGAYRGRYLLQLRHRPLVPGDGTAVFASLELTYALALSQPAEVGRQFVTLDHGAARAYALAPGWVDALVGIGFAYGPGLAAGWATGFRCSYAAGWATGLGDPRRDESTSYGADPLPADLRLAAALLARERLAADAAQNAAADNVQAGFTTSVRVGERAETYRPLGAPMAGQAALGYGGPMSQAAQALLDKYRKRPALALI